MTNIQIMVLPRPRKYSAHSGVALMAIQAGFTGADNHPVASRT